MKNLKENTTPAPWVVATKEQEPLTMDNYHYIIANGGPSSHRKGFSFSAVISYDDALLISKAPDLLQLCEEMKEALNKIKTKPCLACGCSAGSHAEDGRCPEFFNGQLYGWANTFFIAENIMPEIDSALTKYNELFKD